MSVLRSPPLAVAPQFAISAVRVDGLRASLCAAGELDLAAVEDLTQLLAVHLAAGRRFIRLDMAAVTFMDCSCLNILVRTHHRLLAANGQLVLISVSPTVARVFVGLDPRDALLVAPDAVPVLRSLAVVVGPGPQRDGQAR